MAIHHRNKRYQELILAAPYEICIERARYYTESFRMTEGGHSALRAAGAFAHTLKNMSVYILDEERLAGNRSSKLIGTVIPVERGDINTVLEMELDTVTTMGPRAFRIDPADREEIEKEILPYWRGKTLRDRKKELWKRDGLHYRISFGPSGVYRRARALDLKKLRSMFDAPNTSLRYIRRGLEELAYNNPAFVMNVFDVQGHLILGHRNVLVAGFAGIRERASDRLGQARREGDSEGAAFLEAVIISCDAVRDFAGRFADLAALKAQSTADPERKKELLEMAETCRRVPYHPPRSFREAVQALWLTEVCAIIAYGMTGIFAIGRLDQYLYPYYAADREAGRITDAEAVELVEELLLKLSYNILLLPYAGRKTGSQLGSDSGVPTVGGVGPGGNDAVNGLSYLILDAFMNVKGTGNSFTIRLSRKSPETWWKKALETFRHTSGAALFNDEVAIPALEGCGYAPAAAREYGVIGCVEPAGDGDSFACTSGNDISLVGALEMALHDGRVLMMGRRIGPRTGGAGSFSSFDELMDAFRKQVSFLVRTAARAVNLKDRAYLESFPNPYVSSTLDGCVDSARDMTAGGAIYNFGSISARGIGTAANALAAVRRFVFEEKSFSMRELMKALDRNFRGDEKLRARLISRGPKYGCDDEAADTIAREIAEHFCREVAAQRTIRGGPFRPGFFSYGMHVLDGLFLGATPDGRRAGEPVSNSFSPANGSELNGPTAMLRSAARIDHTLISNGCALNVKFMPALFEGEERLGKMVALVKGFFSEGGMEVQPNVVSDETLRDAQLHPERYRDLVVRVSGYSAYFTDLGRPLQDEIIARTSFGRV